MLGQPAPGEAGRATGSGQRKKGSLHAVQAVNFELTYACNLRCSHCLQDGLRDGPQGGWADTAVFSQAIEDATLLGLTSFGVNLTGGEVFRPGSPLPALLATTQRLGAPVRVNTNGWWGRSRHIGVGDSTFDGPDAVVEWLQASGVRMLALSVDERYRQYPSLWDAVVDIIRACEAQGMIYDIVYTGVSGADTLTSLIDLRKRIGRSLRYLQVTSMETVDIGAAAGRPVATTDTSVRERLAGIDCGLRGFYRPLFLHVAPDGGVRSCLYAAGAGWLGNLHDERFFDIVERYPVNPVVELFAGDGLADRAAALMPAKGSSARQFRHPCAVAAALAGAVERRAGVGTDGTVSGRSVRECDRCSECIE